MAAASLWCSRLPCSYRLMISSRQFTVGAMLSLNGASGNKTLQDPVRKLFVQKIKDYKTKSTGGKFPDMTLAEEKILSDELGRLKRIFGEGDLSKFPKFEFKETQA